MNPVISIEIQLNMGDLWHLISHGMIHEGDFGADPIGSLPTLESLKYIGNEFPLDEYCYEATLSIQLGTPEWEKLSDFLVNLYTSEEKREG